MQIFLGTLFIAICVLLIIVVLLQKGRGGGLGSAFGGAGSSAFGTRTGDVFTWVTIVLVALFLLMSAVTTVVLRPPPSVVAQVVFEPASRVVDGPTGITMSCATDEAAIHYTIDGTEPRLSSPTYEKIQVDVQPGVTLKAVAFKPGWKASPMTVVTYVSPAEAAQSAPAGEAIPAMERIEVPSPAPAGGTAGQ